MQSEVAELAKQTSSMSAEEKPSVFPQKRHFQCVDLKGEEMPPSTGSESRVVVCIDETHTPESQAVVKFAAERAKPNDTIVLMSVLPQKLFNPNGYAVAAYPMYPTQYDIEHERRALDALRTCRINEMKGLVHQFAPELQNNVILHTTHEEDVRMGIDQAISYHKPIWVAVGRRPLSHWKRLISSASVSNYLLHHATCPVIVVKCTEENGQKSD